jgi:hypothetical protein
MFTLSGLPRRFRRPVGSCRHALIDDCFSALPGADQVSAFVLWRPTTRFAFVNVLPVFLRRHERDTEPGSRLNFCTEAARRLRSSLVKVMRRQALRSDGRLWRPAQAEQGE